MPTSPASQWLYQATHKLEQADIKTARLDSLVLLEDVTGQDRAYLLAHPEHQLSTAQLAKLANLLSQRFKHVPLAYIRGHAEFYGRTFLISPLVLVPRPESETMIDLLKGLVANMTVRATSNQQLCIADIGTGCGALGITAALELSGSCVDLLDIDIGALQVAKLNVDLLTSDIRVIKSDLLAGSSQNYTILLCNLPYVPDDYPINKAASHEPPIALFGGPDGLALYRKLFIQIGTLTRWPLYILTEAFSAQHDALQSVALQAGYKLLKSSDFIQVFTPAKMN